jgi:hypothetical protein
MNRILVAAHSTPSPYVSTRAVPNPVLRGQTAKATLELRSERGLRSVVVTLPHVLSPDIDGVRVLAMDTPTVIVMETARE